MLRWHSGMNVSVYIIGSHQYTILLARYVLVLLWICCGYSGLIDNIALVFMSYNITTTILGIRKECNQVIWPGSMHYGSLQRLSFMFTWFNIISKQKLTHGKFHHHKLSSQTDVCPRDQCSKWRWSIICTESLVQECCFEAL